MTTATMDDELFRVLRDDAGMPESAAAKVAKLIFRRGESAARAERAADRENFATKVDVANLRAEIPGREDFAAKSDIEILQNKVKNTDSAIERIDQTLLRMDARLDRIDANIVEIKENAARTDEKINSLHSQNKTYVVPFLFLTFTALIALLSKGTLWGVAP